MGQFIFQSHLEGLVACVVLFMYILQRIIYAYEANGPIFS